MKPRITIAEATTPDGRGRLVLVAHDGSFAIRCNGQELMHSGLAHSERELGKLAADHVQDRNSPHILIGGLGLGFTLDTLLSRVARNAVVDVVEWVPAVIQWNREHLRDLNGHRLDDPRVRTRAGDVVEHIARSKPGTYDAILLDIDNGPAAMVAASNRALYGPSGLQSLHRTLRPRGRLFVWSAGPDKPFARRLREAGFAVQAHAAKAHPRDRQQRYRIYLADRK